MGSVNKPKGDWVVLRFNCFTLYVWIFCNAISVTRIYRLECVVISFKRKFNCWFFSTDSVRTNGLTLCHRSKNHLSPHDTFSDLQHVQNWDDEMNCFIFHVTLLTPFGFIVVTGPIFLHALLRAKRTTPLFTPTRSTLTDGTTYINIVYIYMYR